ncbi:MAG: hypothetical protein JEZ07_12705 [Phycisphaerae bacterium]|nr:hypothetical protein [Phycisphaerae bacterium]
MFNLKNKVAYMRLTSIFVVIAIAAVMITVCIGAGKVTWREKTLFTPPKPVKGFCILFSGDWQGRIEPCGCTDRQLGGIDRRTRTIKMLVPGSADGLLLETGPIIEDTSRPSLLKLLAFMQSMKYLNYDAVSLTGIELIKLVEELGMDPADLPTILCTNMDKDQRELYPAVDHISKKINHKGATLDCVVMAVNDPATLKYDKFIADKLKLSDPKKAVIATLDANGIDSESANEKLIIVMVPSDNEEVIESLKEITAIDIIATKGSTDQPEKVSSFPAVITTGHMGKYIARLDIAASDIEDSNAYKFSVVDIDAYFPRDPNVLTFIDDYQISMEMEKIIEDEKAIIRMPLKNADNPFAGNSSCGSNADCHGHEEVIKVWKTLKHAKAMETLERKNVNRQYDPSCVQCHSVGMNYVSGYRSMEKTPDLAGVGCEMCHGPGTQHNKNPLEDYKVVFTRCQQCHDHETSPNFQRDREEYFKRIKHWKNDKLEYWKE